MEWALNHYATFPSTSLPKVPFAINKIIIIVALRSNIVQFMYVYIIEDSSKCFHYIHDGNADTALPHKVVY